jgi:uncharacterized protein YdhG (YjbR/CyaY superfamily)
MTVRTPPPVEDYLAALPDAQRGALVRLRALLVGAIPDAVETIRTRVPALQYRGKTVAGFGAARRHVALYVMVGDALRVHGPRFAGFEVTDRVLRFDPARPPPDALVLDVVHHRLAEIDAQIARAAPRRSRPSPSAARPRLPE